MDAVIGEFDAAANLAQCRTGIVTDFFLGQNTASDLRGQWSQRLQGLEHGTQTIGCRIIPVRASIGFYPVDVLQKTADCEQLNDI